MPIPNPFSFSEKLPAIVGRINPIIDELNVQNAAIQNLESDVTGIVGSGEGPDLTLLFENGLV